MTDWFREDDAVRKYAKKKKNKSYKYVLCVKALFTKLA